MVAIPDIDIALSWTTIRQQAGAYITTEYASLDRGDRPITWPVTPYVGPAGQTIDVSTGLTYPLKAERARRNPRVALSFTHAVGSGLDAPATFVVQGLAAVRDADLKTNAVRYLAQSGERFPELYAGIPRPMMRVMAFYWARIWIEVTPVCVLWWPGGDLAEAPQVWCPLTEVAAPPSDPAPAGRGAGSWNTAEPVPWRRRVRGALERLGTPVLTGVTRDGWPLPLPTRAAEPTAEGFRLRMPAGVEVADGPACLTFHSHGEVFDGQENITIVGRCEQSGEDVEFRAERALNEFVVSANRFRRTVHIVRARRKLRCRLESEARRRGQRVPRFDEVGV